MHPVTSLRNWHLRHPCTCKIKKFQWWPSSPGLLVAQCYAVYFHPSDFHSGFKRHILLPVAESWTSSTVSQLLSLLEQDAQEGEVPD